MRPLRPAESRALALGLLIALIVAAVYAVIEIDRRLHAHYDAAIETQLDLLARYNRIAGMRVDYERAITDIKTRDADKFFLKASAPALAAADIQQIVQTLIEANGLRAESMQVAPHKDHDGYRQISLNMRLRGKLGGVQQMLHSLEATQPYLFVDNLAVQSTVRGNFVPRHDVEPEVMLQMDVSGLARIRKNDAPARR